MTVIDDLPEEEVDLAAPETRAAGRWHSAGVPGEKSKDFKAAVRRLGQMLGGQKIVLAFVALLAVISAFLNVLGPRILGEATDVIVTGSFTGFHSVALNEPVHGEFEGFGTMEATIVG